MKNLKTKFYTFWNNNNVSEQEMKAFENLRRDWINQGKDVSDMLPPIGHRDFVLITASFVVITVAAFIFIIIKFG